MSNLKDDSPLAHKEYLCRNCGARDFSLPEICRGACDNIYDKVFGSKSQGTEVIDGELLEA